MSTQAQFMMVDPQDLVIDMPLDEANVNLKMESLRANTMIQPVTVWLQDMRIIDGFHRTEAARRLGWTEMPCNVIDCTEDAFWDARIQSAKQHATIEGKRLSSWMNESWKLTPWANDSFDERMWEVLGKYGVMPSGAFIVDYLDKPDLGMPEHLVHILRWVDEKAKKWGISRRELAYHISTYAVTNDHGTTVVLNQIANKFDLTFEQRKAMAQVKQTPRRYSVGYEPEQVERWVESEIVTRKPDPKPIANFTIDEIRAESDRKAEEREREEKRRRAFEFSEAGLVAAKKKRDNDRRELMQERIEFVKGIIKSEWTPPDFTEAPAMLAEFAEFVQKFATEHFPGIDIAKPNPVSLDNARLRAENARLRERVASLERALASREVVSASALALSSAELDRMT